LLSLQEREAKAKHNELEAARREVNETAKEYEDVRSQVRIPPIHLHAVHPATSRSHGVYISIRAASIEHAGLHPVQFGRKHGLLLMRVFTVPGQHSSCGHNGTFACVFSQSSGRRHSICRFSLSSQTCMRSHLQNRLAIQIPGKAVSPLSNGQNLRGSSNL